MVFEDEEDAYAGAACIVPGVHSLECEMRKITENEFRLYASTKAIKAVVLTETPEGYVVSMTSRHEPDEMVVHTTRGTPRAWVSVDRLLEHLEGVAPGIRRFTLVRSMEGKPDEHPK